MMNKSFLSPRRKGTIRILAFSDWRVQDYDDLLQFIKQIPTCDVVVYAGDDLDRLIASQDTVFIGAELFFATLPFRRIAEGHATVGRPSIAPRKARGLFESCAHLPRSAPAPAIGGAPAMVEDPPRGGTGNPVSGTSRLSRRQRGVTLMLRARSATRSLPGRASP